MSETSPDPDEPTDESWSKLQRLVAAAAEMDIVDPAYLRKVLETTENEEALAKAMGIMEQVKVATREAVGAAREINTFLRGREAVAKRQYLAETALLDRIKELSKDADADELSALAEAYASLRQVSVAPGEYTPDVRHTGPLPSDAEGTPAWTGTRTSRSSTITVPGGVDRYSAGVAAPPSTPPPEKPAQSEMGLGSGTSAVDVRTAGRRRVELSPAGAAVVAAVCTAAGVYLGAVVTGHYTTAAADSQIAAESRRTTTEFLREQQKTVYAAFIADETELTRRENEFESLLFHAPVNSVPALKVTDATKSTVGTITTTTNIAQLEQLRTQIPAIFDRVDKGDDSIQLIGSDAARTASQNVVNLHFPRLMEILEGGPIINRPQSDFPELEQLGESLPPLPNSPPTPMQEFLTAARKDLGAG